MMPFHGGIEASPNAAFTISLAAAVLYLFLLDRPPSTRRSIVKTLAVALLAVLAALQDGPVLLVAALALGAIGDACLSRHGDGWFLGGLASFLASHLAYVWLFASAGAGSTVLAEPWRIAAIVVVALAAVTLLLVLMRRAPPHMRLPVVAYALAIVAMAVAAFTLDNLAVVCGAVLFVVSDGILATERFIVSAVSAQRKWMRPAVWLTYYAAQLLITLGILLP